MTALSQDDAASGDDNTERLFGVMIFQPSIAVSLISQHLQRAGRDSRLDNIIGVYQFLACRPVTMIRRRRRAKTTNFRRNSTPMFSIAR